jgi:hypothetical protein
MDSHVSAAPRMGIVHKNTTPSEQEVGSFHFSTLPFSQTQRMMITMVKGHIA